MQDNYQQLTEYIKSHNLSGANTRQLKKLLLDAGWSEATVDKAIAEVSKTTPIAQSTRLNSNKPDTSHLWILLGITGALLAAGLLVYSLFSGKGEPTSPNTQTQTTKPLQLYESPYTAFSIEHPEDWTIKDFAPTNEGSYSIRLSGPDNQRIEDLIANKYDIDESTEFDPFSADNYGLINDPELKGFADVSINIRKAPNYNIESSLEEWRQIFDTVATNSLFSVSNLEPATIGGLAGYSYSLETTFEEGRSISTLENIALEPNSQRLEITVFPGDTTKRTQIDQMIKTVKIGK